jgi:phosphoglycerate dehydrogenase-like enzyme
VTTPVRRIHCYGRLPARAVAEHPGPLARWETSVLDDATFPEELPAAEVLFCHAPPPGHWPAAGRLRLIQIVGAGADGLLPAVGLPRSVAIANAGGLASGPMAEFVLAQLLYLVKRLPESIENQRLRSWRVTRPGTLAGRRITILGLGPVGRRTVELLGPFGARLSAVVRRPRPANGVGVVYGVEDLHLALARTDDLVVALPLTPATRGLLGRAEFDAMPPGGHVVNVARGGLIDERAMMDALASGQLAGAALDAVQREPLPADDPLWDARNVLLSAHVSWTSLSYQRDLVELLADNVDRLERGLRPYNEVDHLLGYPPAAG